VWTASGKINGALTFNGTNQYVTVPDAASLRLSSFTFSGWGNLNSTADLNIQAGRRAVGLSLWRPDLDINDPAALGIQVEFLPRDFWALGLGHLGNAYLWSLATLPYLDSGASEIFLNDFDRVEPENVETGLIFNVKDAGRTRRECAASGWKIAGFRPG
jgi:hypothetical protein